MVDRSARHITPDEQMQYFDGTGQETRVHEHMVSCALCRSRLKDLALTRIALAPPGNALTSEHVPPWVLARYVEDSLSMEQNRAVEEHLGRCRRCLSGLISLKRAVAGPLDHAPPETVSAAVKKELLEYSRVAPLGSLFLERFRDEVNLAYRPAPVPDGPETYAEGTARHRYAFRKTALKSRVEEMVQKARSESAGEGPEGVRAAGRGAGRAIRQGMPSGEPTRTVTADHALILFTLAGQDGRQHLTVELSARESAGPLAGITVVFTPADSDPVTLTTDPSGKVVLPIPEGSSTLRIFLEKTWKLDIQAPE